MIICRGIWFVSGFKPVSCVAIRQLSIRTRNRRQLGLTVALALRNSSFSPTVMNPIIDQLEHKCGDASRCRDHPDLHCSTRYESRANQDHKCDKHERAEEHCGSSIA